MQTRDSSGLQTNVQCKCYHCNDQQCNDHHGNCVLFQLITWGAKDMTRSNQLLQPFSSVPPFACPPMSVKKKEWWPPSCDDLLLQGPGLEAHTLPFFALAFQDFQKQLSAKNFSVCSRSQHLTQIFASCITQTWTVRPQAPKESEREKEKTARHLGCCLHHLRRTANRSELHETPKTRPRTEDSDPSVPSF